MRNIFIILGTFLLFFSISKANSLTTYKVKPGDTLSEISVRQGVSWQELMEINKIDDPDKLMAGTKLLIPPKVNNRIIRDDGSVYEISEKEKDILIRLVYAEARGEGLEGQIAVAAVILNRVRSDKFPNTVWDVIHQQGQFTPIQRGTLPSSSKSTGTCTNAVDKALNGEDPTGGALFFYNPETSQAKDYWKTKPVLKRIGNHNFTL